MLVGKWNETLKLGDFGFHLFHILDTSGENYQVGF
jgi:hypothetical protein